LICLRRIDMNTIKKYSSTVTYNSDASQSDGVSLASYRGPIDAETLVDFRTKVIEQSTGVKAFVVEVQAALLLMGIDPFIPSESDYSAIPDGVIVCRLDQIDVMCQYSRYMADRGIIRSVFLQSERNEALGFAARLAGLAKRWPHTPP
jgi:hypothetical protein